MRLELRGIDVNFNGVRTAALLRAQGAGTTGMEPTMAVSLRKSVETVSDPRNLDASVEEVFHMMLGVECHRDELPVAAEPESVTAVVGFGGLLSGACVFHSGAGAAMKIAREIGKSQGRRLGEEEITTASLGSLRHAANRSVAGAGGRPTS